MALARRSFLFGMFAAPAIVRASSLMPVKLFEPIGTPLVYDDILDEVNRLWPNLSDIVQATLRDYHGDLADDFLRNNTLLARLSGLPARDGF